MAISLKVAGTSYTLTQAQLRSLVHTTQANAPATLAGQIYQAAIPEATWSHGDAIELWVGGVRRFAGWLGPVETGCAAGSSYVQIQATDILGRLRGTTFTRYGAEIVGYNAEGVPIYAAGAALQSALTLFSGQLTATDPVSEYYQYAYNSSSSAQIAEVVAFAAEAYPGALALGTITGLSANNLPEKVTDMDCLSVLLRCLSLRPDAVLWVDPSGATPLLHAAIRSALTPITVSVAPGNSNVRGWSCRDRSDRLLEYLEWRLQYTYKTYIYPADPGKGVTAQPVVLVYNYGDGGAPADKCHLRRFQLGSYAPVYTSGAAAYAQLGTPISQLPMTAAADYWAANSVLHYEGHVSLYEPGGCSYAWSLGQTLNLSGATTAYASAAALVRGVTYDHVAGTTAIDFGPADALSAGDLLAGASSLGATTLGGITPSTADTQTEDPAQTNAGKGESAGEQADTLTQRIQDKLGSFALLAGSGFQVSIKSLTATLCGQQGFVATTPPNYYLRDASTLLAHWGCQSVKDHTGSSALTRVYDPAAGCTYTDTTSSTGDALGCISASWVGASYTDSTADLSAEWSGNGIGCPCPSQIPGEVGDRTLARRLTQQDTDALALERAKALASWSAWADYNTTINAGTPTWQTVRTEGRVTTAKVTKIRGTLRSNIYGYSLRVSVPLYRYSIGGVKPSTPTSTQVWDLYLVDTLENIADAGHEAVWVHTGVATLPEWEVPVEQGYITLADTPKVELP